MNGQGWLFCLKFGCPENPGFWANSKGYGSQIHQIPRTNLKIPRILLTILVTKIVRQFGQITGKSLSDDFS